MNDRFPNNLVFKASGLGDSVTASQAIGIAKEFLCGLERVSPWARPFDVSGATAKTGNMPIDSDLADFDDVVMTALKTDDDVRYQNESDVNDWKLGRESRSPYGFNFQFSNYIQTMDNRTRVSVSLKTPGTSRWLSDSNIAVIIPSFLAGEKNYEWSKMETILNVFDYLIDFGRPLSCVVYLINEESKFYNAKERFTIGLLTYTRNPRVIAALAGHPLVHKYRDGILIKLGDSVAAFSDPQTDLSISELREKVRAAGATDWLKL